MDRIILHCDCNSFFASVEMLSRPELRNVPMAVTGDPENRHGIILAKNELAKKYNVQTAETIWQAKSKCPGLVCVRAHHDAYEAMSKRVNAIYLDYTDLVEPFGIDESFLDVSQTIHLFGKSASQLADDIRARVRTELGITISVGVSFCKVFAKLGSDFKKPDATTVFDRASMQAVIYKLPVSDMLYAGRKTTEMLGRWGIRTIGELAAADRRWIAEKFGEAGDTLWQFANGLDNDPVRSFYEKRTVKSVGNGMTFRRDISGEEEIRAGVSSLCDEICGRMRAIGKKGQVVQVSVKDPNFKVRQRQQTLKTPTWLQKDLIDACMELLHTHFRLSDPIRTLTVTVSALCDPDESSEQLSIFDDAAASRTDARQEDLEKTIETIRQRHGRASIYQGLYDKSDIGVSTIKKGGRKNSAAENGKERGE